MHYERIKYYRALAGMTQSELGKRCDLSTNYISKIETGDRLPSLEALANICLVLDIPMAFFFGTDAPPYPRISGQLRARISGLKREEQLTILQMLITMAEQETHA
ncbi:MAG: helix-turn-helix domain-containing protein [Clostridiales bacterium]|nr:helix-turn-helix domain-containing protein [Clostridiales bacterium]